MSSPASAPNSDPYQAPNQAPAQDPLQQKLLPGMAIIALWMLFEAAIGAYGVYAHIFSGQNRYGVLGLATILTGCGLGLLQRRRWGWALALGMAFFSLCFGSYALMRLHAPQALVLTFLNGVFFLYLVRPETRSRLRR